MKNKDIRILFEPASCGLSHVMRCLALAGGLRKEGFKVGFALKDTLILKDDFSKVLDHAKKDDFVYLDCPYHPLSKTANFTSYTMNNFGEEQQKRL